MAAEPTTRNEFELGPPVDVYRADIYDEKTRLWMYVRQLLPPPGSEDDPLIRIFYVEEPNGTIKSRGYTKELMIKYSITTGSGFVKLRPKGVTDPQNLNVRKKDNPENGISFYDDKQSVEKLMAKMISSADPVAGGPPFTTMFKVEKEKMRSRIGFVPPQCRDCLQWEKDGKAPNHWVLGLKKEKMSIEDFIKAASYLLLPDVRMEAQATRGPESFGRDEEDSKIWAEILQKGANFCVHRVHNDMTEGGDDDDDDDEALPLEEHRYLRLVHTLVFVLGEYEQSWINGWKRIHSSEELSKEDKVIFRTLLSENWDIYRRMVFLVAKFHEPPSRVFEALGSRRIFVFFICSYIEDCFASNKTRLRLECHNVQWLARELLMGYWRVSVRQLREELPARTRISGAIGPDEQKKILANFASTIDIVTDIHETGSEWSVKVNVRDDTSVEKLTERYHAVVAELRESISSGNYLAWSMRKAIMQLFADMLETISVYVCELRKVAADLPYLMRHVMMRNKSRTVLEAIDVHCACLSWKSRLCLVWDDVSSMFPVEQDERMVTVPPDDDAPLSDMWHAEEPKQEIMERARQHYATISGDIHNLTETTLKRRRTSSDTYSSYVNPSLRILFVLSQVLCRTV